MPERVETDRSLRWRSLFAFACLYISLGATLGFLGGGAPIILRAHGLGLAQVGLLQLIYLPLGLTFLWARLIDRLHWPLSSHRIGWIAVTQMLSVALLLILTKGEAWTPALLFVMAVAISFAFATMDVSLEALVVETVPATDRPLVTTAKLCGSSVGGMLGVGLLAISFARLGWPGSLLALAGVNAICLLPILSYPENALRHVAPASQGETARRHWGALLRHGLFIGFYFAASGLLLTPASLVLIDLHASVEAVGFVTGTLGPAINLSVTLCAGLLISRFSPARLVVAMALGVLVSGCLMIIATLIGSGSLGIAAVVLDSIAAACLGVPVFNMIYRWAQGRSAATDYSLLFGIGFLAALPARVGGPALAQLLGWPGFFAIATPLYVASVWLLGRAMLRTEEVDAHEVRA